MKGRSQAGPGLFIKRGIKRAIKAAQLSDFKHHRVGAALYRKNKLISIGWNTKKGHPKCPNEHSRHAEFNVFIGVPKEKVRGCRLFIARITRTGRVSISKPCEDCEEFLSALSLSSIYYTNRKGEAEILK